MIVVILSLALIQETPTERQIAIPSEREFCAISERVAAMMRGMPPAEQNMLRTDGFDVSCRSRRYEWRKTVTANEVPANWSDEQLSEFSRMICSNPIFRAMRGRGWRFIQLITMPGGAQREMDASCPPA